MLADRTTTYEVLRTRLESFQQEHLLQFWDDLGDREREQLREQIEGLDLDLLSTLITGQHVEQDFEALAASASAPPAVRVDGSGADWSIADARERGEEALRDGEVGAVIVAGGQGTRLGFAQPKGMFPVGPVSQRTLFQFFADRLSATCERYGVVIPLYVMTSDATDTETREYFQQNDYLGLSPQNVRIFKQGTIPAVDAKTGKLLLAAKDSLALSPDGHGGTVSALVRSGSLSDAERRGVKHLFYIQVDNPLANLCDPTLIGHHLMAQSEMTTQVVRKRYAMERVGNVVFADGNVRIIEYSDLPESAARATNEDGQLKLWAGNIAVHLLDVAFLKRVSQSDSLLPFHRALKKVSYVDSAGHPMDPSEPNATKFERFIFDLLPQAANAFVVESLPSEAFAPVKNADGAETDTPALAKEAISKLHRSWLEQAGVAVHQGVRVEINPRFSLSPADLAGKVSANQRIEADHYFDG